ncbi:uncharacterized protein TRIADDRAFT_10225, partial [Trichoplax adhaerens]
WLNPLFKLAAKRRLEQSDLFDLSSEDKTQALIDRLDSSWQHELEKCQSTKGNPSLSITLFHCFGRKFLLLAIPCSLTIFQQALTIAQPLLIGGLVNYFTSSVARMPEWQAYLYAAGLSCSAFLITMTEQSYYFGAFRYGMQVRAALSAIIYNKALKISNIALSQTSTGNIINLLANDTQRFNDSTMYLHFIWAAPLQLICLTAILWVYIGPSCLVGLGVLALMIASQAIFAKFYIKFRQRYLKLADRRVRIMNDILSNIRVIKMYAWENSFSNLVNSTRMQEVSKIRLASYMQAINLGILLVSTSVIAFASLLTYVELGNALDPSTVFTVFSVLNALQITIMEGIPESIRSFADLRLSLKRIEKYLLLDEVTVVESEIPRSESFYRSPPYRIEADNISASWNTYDEVLTNVSFSVKPKELCAIVGSVGCGKSSLLMAIMRELQITRGSLNCNGSIVYLSQQPWIFAGTVRENILFGRDYNQEKYDQVIEVCALTKDLLRLSDGDLTFVGERGVHLSGGQRARVSLARAVYSEADIYIFDDPLSAVDPYVAKHIYEKCIRRYLYNRCRILVTHQVQLLNRADKIIVISNGTIAAMGSYKSLLQSSRNFVELLPPSDEDSNNKCAESDGYDSNSYLGVTKSYSSLSIASASMIFNADVKMDQEERQEGSVTMKTYIQYFVSGLGVFVFILFILLCVISQATAIFTDWWLARWSDSFSNGSYNDSYLYGISKDTTISIYGVLVVVSTLLSISRSVMIAAMAVNASKSLHNQMFSSVIKTLVYFFDTNPLGRTLNRFSKDLSLMDDKIPFSLLHLIQSGLYCAGVVILSAVVNPWILIPALLILVLFIFVRRFYLHMSRDIKRIEAVNNSPIYSHLSSTLNGLITVRAYNKEEDFKETFVKYQDAHSQAWIIFIASLRWNAFHLDLLCDIFITCTAFAALLTSRNVDPGAIGLSLSYSILLLGNFQWAVRQSAELENQMTSVERVKEYSQLPPEAPLRTHNDPSPNVWPSKGVIRFRNLHYSHHEDLPFVLKRINCKIYPSEKIGIVGRTGAGKSSFMASLFRLAEPDGKIFIDGVDISKLGLHSLRSQISVIPQEPVLFIGSIRQNLDPFHEHTDNEIWDALQEVHLSSYITELSEQLDTEVAESGTNFSVGQKQLICLARALLRRNKILIIDEATANVDFKTDTIIQQSIRDKFQECTVLTIAHRLNTIIDSDRVMVLNEGLLVEMDTPYNLLQDENSFFYRMVRNTGPTEFGRLHDMARDALLTKRN